MASSEPIHFLHAGQFRRRDGLSFSGRHVGLVLATAASVAVSTSNPLTPLTPSLALDGTNYHLRRPELEDLGHGKVGNPVESDIEGFDVGNIPVGRLGDEMASDRTRQTGHI